MADPKPLTLLTGAQILNCLSQHCLLHKFMCIYSNEEAGYKFKFIYKLKALKVRSPAQEESNTVEVNRGTMRNIVCVC